MDGEGQVVRGRCTVHLSRPGRELSWETTESYELLSVAGAEGECERVAGNKAENADRNGITKGLRR